VSAPKPRHRGGFSLMELLVTMIVLGVLAGIAAPSFRAATSQADAARIVADMSVVRLALFEFREENGALPRRGRWGRVPPDLVPHLNMTRFTYADLDYRLTTNVRRGRVDFLVRYPRNSPIGNALKRYRRAGNDSGSVSWGRTRTRFRLMENNQ